MLNQGHEFVPNGREGNGEVENDCDKRVPEGRDYGSAHQRDESEDSAYSTLS